MKEKEKEKFKFSPQKIIQFFNKDIWQVKVNEQKPIVRPFFKALKVLTYSYQGFVKDEVQLRASALTFYSLLSIVPLLAMAFGIAKGFQLEKQFQEKLIESFSGQTEVIDKSIEFAQQLLENTKGGVVAGVGFAVLIFSVIRLFSNIELSFNSIWQVNKERVWVRKLTDYLVIVLLAPVFLVGASSLTYQITQTIQELTSKVQFLGFFEIVILPLLKILPYTIIWIFFTLMYMIMPNTKVNFKSAFISAIFAGTIYQFTQWGLINFQVGVAKYNAIYGSFAALPLFLFWLQLSWLLFLFGAEVAFSHQNIGDYQKEFEEKELSRTAKLEAIFVILNYIIKRFNHNKTPHSFEKIALNLKIPVKITHLLLEELVRAKVLIRTEGEEGELNAFYPAIDTDKITFAFVIDRLDNLGNLSLWEDKDFNHSELREMIENIKKERHLGSGAHLIKNYNIGEIKA